MIDRMQRDAIWCAFNRGHTGDVLGDGRSYFRYEETLWSVPLVSLTGFRACIDEADPIAEQEGILTLRQIETVCCELETLLYGDGDFPETLRHAVATLEYFQKSCPEDWRAEDQEFLDFLRAQQRKFEGQGTTSAPV